MLKEIADQMVTVTDLIDQGIKQVSPDSRVKDVLAIVIAQNKLTSLQLMYLTKLQEGETK